MEKTGIAVDLMESGRHYFLSRPRRFVKSLFLDTFKDLFEGQKPRFKGLAVGTSCASTDKYRAGGEPIHLIGVEFSRNIVGFEVETLAS